MRTRFLPFLAALLVSGCSVWVPVPPAPPDPSPPIPAPPEPTPLPPDTESVALSKWNAVTVGMPRAEVITNLGMAFRSVTVEGSEVLVWRVASAAFGMVSGEVTMDATGHVLSKVLW